ncbi:glycine betaine ABC transporter substrate-binding protein [Actinoplanes couchii]|uniref:Glycine/betaine ABC transporter substrate-binding protein n=1 Tax=Actinoplanes couchii TaxID=403638 RepID=A0ABQ3XTC0_9ACTN|nr:glycine betaine ABC transporter substrate-binding protein [Actinoplanes couchii]MDR6319044.1 osmoprotectant transport system substrate-binding protein [Actinoplanes couchii]GID61748.1 glycine/betaine ABC transporter substrate-binding protein [Actinoplanes couchii]
MNIIKRTTAIAAGFGLLLASAACGSDDEGGSGTGPLAGTTVTVGSKDFDEQLVLGQITKLALENAGAGVKDQTNLGGTNAARAALTAGEVDVYWEYTGTAWISFFQQTEPIADPKEQWQKVADKDLADNKLVWMTPAGFNNTYGIAYSADAAATLGNPKTISDLGTNTAAATLCVESEFSTRDDGLPGLQKKYGFEIPSGNVTVLDTGIVYTSTAKQDPCNFGEVFTTDGRIKALNLTVLEDDKAFFPLYNAAPVFRSEYYDANQAALKEIFDPIAAALTQDVMTELNKQVSVDGARPEQVAKQWLKDQSFLS